MRENLHENVNETFIHLHFMQVSMSFYERQLKKK